EAEPSLKITTVAEGDITIPFTSLTGTCSLSDRNAGYTACYPIATNTYGTLDQWSIQSVSLTNPARVLIADTTGAGNSLDLFTLTGVKFVPGSTFDNNQHVVQVFVTNTFDAAPNPAGNYLFAMRTGGYFVTSFGGNNLLNTVSLSGFGDFSGSGFVSVPILPTLTMQVGSPTSTAVSFSLSQIQQYDSFPCDNGLGGCTPTIQLTF